MKFLLETLAALVGGLVGWFVVGFTAAQILESIYGSREGSAGMGGFFVIGPLGGIAGFALVFWLVRRRLEPVGSTTGLGTLLRLVLALSIVVGVTWGAVSLLVAARRPQPWVGLKPGDQGRIEFRVQVPDTVTRGRPLADVIALSFSTTELDAHSEVTPLAWNAAHETGFTTLSGSVPVATRPHEQYIVVKQAGEEYNFYAPIPPDMYSEGRWQDTVYLGRDPATPMSQRVSITCRYQPPRR